MFKRVDEQPGTLFTEACLIMLYYGAQYSLVFIKFFFSFSFIVFIVFFV